MSYEQKRLKNYAKIIAQEFRVWKKVERGGLQI